ncbi:hypothetical protein GGF43_001629 [Coemansia sp. RSA 2618]|nr:hypothetical protein GGF43_001629 [Coemansia sp. RSA 2618]
MSTEDKGAPANPDPDSLRASTANANSTTRIPPRGEAEGSRNARRNRQRTVKSQVGDAPADAAKAQRPPRARGRGKANSTVAVKAAGGGDAAASVQAAGERSKGGGAARSEAAAVEQQRAKTRGATDSSAQVSVSGEERAPRRPRRRRGRGGSKADTQAGSTEGDEGSQSGAKAVQGGAKAGQGVSGKPGQQDGVEKPKLSRRAKAAIAKQARGAETAAVAGTPAEYALPDQLTLGSGVERLEPATKVCVRWLPADLPEHVFWQTVEAALPWFDPSRTGAVRKEDRLVLEASRTVDTDEPRAEDESGSAAQEEPGADGTGGPALPHAATKVVAVDVYESANLARLDGRPYWRQYVAGKQHRSRAKPTEPSRAYIVFATAEEARRFYQAYHGHVFSKNDVQTRAQVEMAAFQYVARAGGSGGAWRDPLEGTIDGDPAFQEFLNPQAAGDKRALAHASYAAAATASSDASGPAGETPLIQYLRKLKAHKPGGRVPAKVLARPGNKPAASKAAASKPASSKPAAASKKAKDGAPKKPRRQNR